MNLQTRAAQQHELPAIRELLAQAELPVGDLDTSPAAFWVAEQGRTIVGVIGLERYEDAGLLRSLAVAPGARRRGVARALLATLEREAGRTGVATLVLLTQTAQAYFAAHGYRVTDRAAVAGPVRATAQFRLLCPASAACMTKSL